MNPYYPINPYRPLRKMKIKMYHPSGVSEMIISPPVAINIPPLWGFPHPQPRRGDSLIEAASPPFTPKPP